LSIIATLVPALGCASVHFVCLDAGGGRSGRR
jgi:hypothetical protein